MSNETKKIIQALLLYAIRELQDSIQYDPELHAHNLKQWYGIEIAPDEIALKLEDIAESIYQSETKD